MSRVNPAVGQWDPTAARSPPPFHPQWDEAEKWTKGENCGLR